MFDKGLVVSGKDDYIETACNNRKINFVVSDKYALPFDKTIFIESGIKPPWNLFNTAYLLLDNWQLCLPFWRYNVLAKDIASNKELKEIVRVVGDARVPLYCYELMLAKHCRETCEFFEAFSDYVENGFDKRISLLLSLHVVKPLFCTLPINWLNISQGVEHRIKTNMSRPLVTVELEPGRYVKVHKGDEQKVLDQFNRQKGHR